MKILLACNAGMSTSLLVQKLQKEAASRGLDAEIIANPLNKALELIDGADVFCLDLRLRMQRQTLRLQQDLLL